MVDILDKNIYQVGDLATELHPQSTIHKSYILASSRALQANKQKPVLNFLNVLTIVLLIRNHPISGSTHWNINNQWPTHIINYLLSSRMVLVLCHPLENWRYKLSVLFHTLTGWYRVTKRSSNGTERAKSSYGREHRGGIYYSVTTRGKCLNF